MLQLCCIETPRQILLSPLPSPPAHSGGESVSQMMKRNSDSCPEERKIRANLWVRRRESKDAPVGKVVANRGGDTAISLYNYVALKIKK